MVGPPRISNRSAREHAPNWEAQVAFEFKKMNKPCCFGPGLPNWDVGVVAPKSLTTDGVSTAPGWGDQLQEN